MKEVRSELSILKEANPGYNWPEQGPRRNYPEEYGAYPGDIRRFGFRRQKYRLILRTSCEKSAIERVEELATEGKKALITYNPIRLETYGVWCKTT